YQPITDGKDPHFEKFIEKNCTKDFMRTQGKDLLPDMYRHLYEPPQGATCSEENRHRFLDMRKKQADRKQAELAIRSQREGLLSVLLESNPKYQQVKARYDAIKKCEQGALN